VLLPQGSFVAGRNRLNLGNYLPYLINRVGFALVERMIPIAKELEQIASTGISARELAVAKRALGRMYDNLMRGR
jgi:hypothetical protein